MFRRLLLVIIAIPESHTLFILSKGSPPQTTEESKRSLKLPIWLREFFNYTFMSGAECRWFIYRMHLSVVISVFRYACMYDNTRSEFI